MVTDRCARCDKNPARVTSYWDPAKRFCGPCCEVIAAEFDATDSWPPVPNETRR